jgi:hypothetical protein
MWNTACVLKTSGKMFRNIPNEINVLEIIEKEN